MDDQVLTKPNANPCNFCNILNKPASHDVGIDVPWLKGSGYAALVSVGALVPGWSLLCPTGHATSMLDSYHSDVFWEFAARAEEIVREEYGSVRVFEHGARFDGSLTACGTNHAHLHLVPLDFSLEDESQQFDPSLTWVRCSIAEIEQLTMGSEYLFVSDKFQGGNTVGLLCVLKQSTSQYFRRVIAKKIGKEDQYNYRHFPMLAISSSTAKLLGSHSLMEAA